MGTPSVAFRLTRISFRDSKLPTKRKDSPRHTTRHLHSERLANSFRSAEGLLVPKSSLKTIPAHTSTGGSTFPDTEAVYSRIRLLQRYAAHTCFYFATLVRDQLDLGTPFHNANETLLLSNCRKPELLN